MTANHSRLALVSLAMVLCIGGCAAPQAPTAKAPEGARPNGAPKTLTLGTLQEPQSLNMQVTGGTPGAGAASQLFNISHDTLMVEDTLGSSWPQLTTQVPSLADGTWRVNESGTMEMTWKLRPNIKWHDGRPFTSDDLAFSFRVYKDPAVPNQERGAIAAASSASAPDASTFVVSWSSIYAAADEAKGLAPLPRHILGSVYEQDPTALAESPWFTTEFAGLGPYRLDTWDQGSQMKFVRFDDYYQGRPPLDVLIIRFAEGPTMIANILAGAIDVAFPSNVGIDPLEMKQRWEGTANQVIITPRPNFRAMDLQVRPELAEPRNGLPNRLVRQALYSALDREGLSQSICSGLCPAADSWISPADPVRSAVESAIPQYRLDPARASELLAEAGWIRGADGVVIDGQTGDRFRLMVAGGLEADRENAIAADAWKAIGVEANIYSIPRAQDTGETRTKLSGVQWVSAQSRKFLVDRLHSSSISTAANNWAGANKGGYANARLDAALDKLVATIDSAERVPLHRQMVAEGMGDVALMPTFWLIDTALVLDGVKGIRARGTWNVFEWDITRGS